jgi:alpha-ribazole phosphatase
MRLLLVPHALTDWNEGGRYQGHSDTALSSLGRMHANLLATRLVLERIDAVYVSDLRRAKETAQTLFAKRPLRSHSDPRLRELHFGAWEGLTYEEVQRDHSCALQAWEEDPLRYAPPGGETLTHLSERVGNFLKELSCLPDQDSSILVFAHRGSLRVLICLALGLPTEARWQFHLEPASLSELSWMETRPNRKRSTAILNFLNDTNHLREAVHAG